jgi:predicted phage-related endonuclease
MAAERIPISGRAQWLARRKFDVTASSVGAVFGSHPYVSPLRLYVQKQGLIDLPDQSDGGVLRRGRILEHAMPAAVAEQRSEWRLEKCQDYFHDDAFGIGATPDFFIHGDARGLGVLQAKTTVPAVFEREWQTDENGKTNPPRWIELQAATEMMLTNAVFGAVAVLVIDPFELPCVITELVRDADLEAKIKKQVIQFWQDIQDGREPDANYGMDRELLAQMLPREREGLTVDLSGDNEMIDALIERRDLKKRITEDEKRCEVIEAMLMKRMGKAAFAQVPDFSVSWKIQHRKGYTVSPSNPRVLNIRPKKNSGLREAAA